MSSRTARIEPLETRIAPAVVFPLSSLDGSDGFKINGAASGDRFGHRVSAAGDVNGDGFDDVIVGAYQANPNGLSSGASYVVFGKTGGFGTSLDLATLDGTNGFQINGEAAGDIAGFAVSSAGDVNGDTFDDVIVGAPDADPNGTGSGASYVIFGKASGFPAALNLSVLDGTDGFQINGEATDDSSGEAVGAAGDINGDGFDDVIIGAPDKAPNGFRSGASYVVFGRANFVVSPTPGFALELSALDGTDGLQLNGPEIDSKTATSVSAAGDVNNDTFDDIIIGAPGGDTQTGEAFVVFGKASFTASGTTGFALELSALDGSDGFRIQGTNTGDRTGRSASGAGDVNRDGFDDIILGAHEADGGRGKIYVVFGQTAAFPATLAVAALDGTNGYRIDAEPGDVAAGRAVSGAGDVNGDGFDDILIGAPGHDDEPNRGPGASYVVFGRATVLAPILKLASLDGASGFKIRGEANGDASGYALSAAGDIDGDGFDDVIIGGYRAYADASDAGAAYVIFGAAGVDTKPGTIVVLDGDGDTVTIKLNGALLTARDITRAADGGIAMVDLTRFVAPGAKAMALTISAKTLKGGTGDGIAQIEMVNAAGLDLGAVKLKADIGLILAGDADPLKPALKSLTVSGALGPEIAGADAAASELLGDVRALTIKGGVRNASIEITGAAGKISITGDLVGEGGLPLPLIMAFAETGRVPRVGGGLPMGAIVAGSISSFSVSGSMLGGSVTATGDVGTAKIGGDFRNSSFVSSGVVRVVKVLGELTADDPAAPAIFAAQARLAPGSAVKAAGINSFNIRRDVTNALILIGYDKALTGANPDASLGTVTIGGNWTASSLAAAVLDSTDDGFGQNDTLIAEPVADAILARIASITIKGTATGSAAAGDHFAITAQHIGALKIGGVKIALTKDAPDDVLLDEVNGDFRVVEIA